MALSCHSPLWCDRESPSPPIIRLDAGELDLSAPVCRYLPPPVPSRVWWNFPIALSGDFDGSVLGGEVKRLSDLFAESAPPVDLP
jgi:hypothetical protein